MAGDNAIVIALAARALPPTLRRKAIVWDTVGAVLVRAMGQQPGAVECYEFITYAGAGVLAYTGAHMVVSEPLLGGVFDACLVHRVLAHALAIAGVLLGGSPPRASRRLRLPARLLPPAKKRRVAGSIPRATRRSMC